MKKRFCYSVALGVALSFACVTAGFAQKAKPVQKTPKQIVFAVLSDGKSLEPIAYLEKGKLEQTVNGSDSAEILAAFAKSYYKTGTTYNLVFGGASAGKVTVKSANNKYECAPNTANITVSAPKANLRGNVMALATNATVKNKTIERRRPTVVERREIESLVNGIYATNKLTPKTLNSQNLTVLDVDNDGRPDFVGSYWVDVDKSTRALVFFIAEKGSDGKIRVTYSDFRTIDQGSVMSGDIKDVDNGIYHELLLDAFDYDGDGHSEIFTYTASFEGAGFTAYKKVGDKWTKAIEVSNYHCGY